jgi:cation diffusion facilitator CzcD-associated flavoprotein CzcO
VTQGREGTRGLRCAVIGAGMAGILAAIRLREAGYDDVVLYEKADRPGGTWRENSYPGLACDVPSHF